jgi:hypothetical protein
MRREIILCALVAFAACGCGPKREEQAESLAPASAGEPAVQTTSLPSPPTVITPDNKAGSKQARATKAKSIIAAKRTPEITHAPGVRSPIGTVRTFRFQQVSLCTSEAGNDCESG